MDGWPHFDYNVQIPSHINSKCHILDITWSLWRWLCGHDEIFYPHYVRRLTQGIRCNEILGQGSGNIGGVLDDFLQALLLIWVTD